MAKTKEERKAYMKAYREANKESIRAEKKEYAAAHKEEKKVYNREYALVHKEEIRVQKKEYYDTHHEYFKEYKEVNRDRDRIKSREYYDKNREKIRQYDKERAIKKWGLALEEYEEMLKKIDGKCPLCKIVLDNSRQGAGCRAVVDHCHLTNKLRGIICASCNSALGVFDDRSEVLQRAIDYLKKFETPATCAPLQ